jgi:hypothetical protein
LFAKYTPSVRTILFSSTQKQNPAQFRVILEFRVKIN